MATHAQRKAQTRLNIISAAKSLFDRQGVNKTSVEQIYTAANLSKGAFYKHFKNKLDLLIALEKEQAREQRRLVLHQVQEGKDAIQVLYEYMDILADWFIKREKSAEAMVMTQLGKDSHLPENHDPETSLRGFLAQLLSYAQEQGRLRSDKESTLLAQVLGGAIVVAVITWSQHTDGINLQQSLRDSLDVFLTGAITSEAGNGPDMDRMWNK